MKRKNLVTRAEAKHKRASEELLLTQKHHQSFLKKTCKVQNDAILGTVITALDLDSAIHPYTQLIVGFSIMEWVVNFSDFAFLFQG